MLRVACLPGDGIGPEVTAVAIEGDGKIIAAGGSGRSRRNRDFLLVRYRRDGSIDS